MSGSLFLPLIPLRLRRELSLRHPLMLLCNERRLSWNASIRLKGMGTSMRTTPCLVVALGTNIPPGERRNTNTPYIMTAVTIYCYFGLTGHYHSPLSSLYYSSPFALYFTFYPFHCSNSYYNYRHIPSLEREKIHVFSGIDNILSTLNYFNVSTHRGFLPETDPLQRLPHEQ